MSDTEQAALDTYREMNRYDGRDEDWRSDAVYTEPRRTLANGWMKFHAVRDCGARKVYYVEETNSRPTSETYEYALRCWDCGHRVDEDDVLFIGGEWFDQHGWLAYGNTTDKLNLPADRVLDLGPDPDREELVDALELTRIEQNASVFGLTFGNERYHECADCGRETFLVFDDHCRMCYDGEWTDRMQSIVESAETSIRERNNSFVHRLESHVDPLSIHGRAYEDKVLWRRHDAENVSKLVVVTQCLQDDSDGHWEYILTDLTHTSEWRYHEDDLAACFWDTGLYDREQDQPGLEGKLRETHQRVCDHSFHTVYEDGDPAGEQCPDCKLWRTDQ